MKPSHINKTQDVVVYHGNSQRPKIRVVYSEAIILLEPGIPETQVPSTIPQGKAINVRDRQFVVRLKIEGKGTAQVVVQPNVSWCFGGAWTQTWAQQRHVPSVTGNKVEGFNVTLTEAANAIQTPYIACIPHSA